MKNSNKLYIGKLIALVLVLLSILYWFQKSTDLEKNSIISVARIYKISHTKYVSKNASYEYFYEGKKYQGSTRLEEKYNKGVLKKFFEVRFSKVNPKNSEIDLSIEIIDSNRIREASFNFN